MIGDRHDLSSQAYQGRARHRPAAAAIAARRGAGDFRPDLTLYLDLPPALGLQRARQRGELDRIEQESFAFLSEPARAIGRWRRRIAASSPSMRRSRWQTSAPTFRRYYASGCKIRDYTRGMASDGLVSLA